jgi:hypothetical protein
VGRLVIALLVLSFATLARAQSVYVAGTIGADVSRVSHTDSNFFSPPTPNGSETISGSLRVGTALGPAWGVELEFVYSGRSHDRVPVSVLPLATNTPITVVPGTAGGFTLTSASASVIPVRFPETEIRQRHSDLDALIWARQGVGESVDLVYLGGVAFSRQRVEATQSFPTILGLFAPPPNGAFQTTTISYGTRPLAGIEARIRFTSHVRLIPGVRLQGIADGWLLRPYVGLGWFF